MGKKHVVVQGECISSIAFTHGFLPEKIWDHPENRALRSLRKDSSVLLEGDEVFIPDCTPARATVASGARHVFVRKGVPEKLRVRLLDGRGKPRSNLAFVLYADDLPERRGKTDGDGVLEAPISPTTARVRIVVEGNAGGELHELDLGHLDPIGHTSGIQARLSNLGYYRGAIDGEAGPLTSSAIRAFQSDRGLRTTGSVDEALVDALFEAHDNKEG
jgi:hypothetical protein